MMIMIMIKILTVIVVTLMVAKEICSYNEIR